MQSFEDKPVS